MNFEIITPNGDLRREVWRFNFYIDSIKATLRLINYRFEDKATRRHGWKVQRMWDAYYARNNTIDRPFIPSEVATKLREQITAEMNKLDIV